MPPRKYADAPATLSSDAAISPPEEDSAMVMVSLRCLSNAPIFSARGSRSFIASLPLTSGTLFRLEKFQRHAIALADREILRLVGVAQAQRRRQRPHALRVVLGISWIRVDVGFSCEDET